MSGPLHKACQQLTFCTSSEQLPVCRFCDKGDPVCTWLLRAAAVGHRISLADI
jgi:hypothetical protein